MQRSHDSLALDISAYNWCAEQNVTRGYNYTKELWVKDTEKLSVLFHDTWLILVNFT